MTHDITDYRHLIEAALVYDGGAHTTDDVIAAVGRGEAQFWPAPHSCMVTEIDRQPRQSVLNFFLAAGVMGELEAMTPGILAWGEEHGCTVAHFLGRKGWARSFLAQTGWQDSGLIIMEKRLNGVRQVEGNQ